MKNLTLIPASLLKVLTVACLLTTHFSARAENKFTHYQQTNLVSDQAGVAVQTDAKLRNAWGIAFNPNGPAWLANNYTGTSTLYDGNGTPIASLPFINVPDANDSAGKPTGVVFNSSKDFNVTPNNPAAFIFANESGSLAAWNPVVDLHNAKIVGQTVPGNPIYKGLALAANGKGHFLYATDFHNAKVLVFDNAFQLVDAKNALGCDFSDSHIPVGYAPFGIQNINGALYVTYAKQDANKEDDVAGSGLGYVNIFDANGCLIKRFASKGTLNAPWAVALAPANFGAFSNQILVGNFGDGTINAFNPLNTHLSGVLRNTHGKKIKISGLWGLAFGNGVLDQATNTLFFAAGPNDEINGLYGKINAVK